MSTEITAEKLKKLAPRIADPEAHAAALERARQNSSVNTPRRLCHFLGQVMVETGGFTAMEENFNYRDPARLDAIFSAVRGVDDARALIARGPQAIANRVYANRLGNGNEASGDGWRYRGSGYKQLTGRSNFQTIGQKVGIDLVGQPELARQPADAARVAFAFWDSVGCSPLADRGDVEGVTAKVNGPAKLGLKERRDATLRALTLWPEEPAPRAMAPQPRGRGMAAVQAEAAPAPANKRAVKTARGKPAVAAAAEATAAASKKRVAQATKKAAAAKKAAPRAAKKAAPAAEVAAPARRSRAAKK